MFYIIMLLIMFKNILVHTNFQFVDELKTSKIENKLQILSEIG